MYNREARSRIVAWGLAMTENTRIAPGEHERELLAAFVEGELTLDEVLAQLELEEQAQTAS